MISIIGASLKKLRDDAYQASLSPDGSQILYVDTVAHSINVMNADGSQARPVIKAEKGSRLFAPTWFPNGKRFFYGRARVSQDNPQVFTMSCDPNGGDPQVLLQDVRVTFMTLEQPGRAIYSLSEPPPHQYDRNLYELHYNPDTGKPEGTPHQLTNWSGYAFSAFHTTSDGKHFVFLNGKTESAVYVAPLSNNADDELKSADRLTLNAALNWMGAHTPDGKSIVFTSNRDGNFNVYVQGLTERTARAVASAQEHQLSPTVSPDGKWILYVQWPKPVPPKLTVDGGKVMRVPVSGGAPEFVMDVVGNFTLDSDPLTPDLNIPNIKCPLHSGDCVVGEIRDNRYVLTAFDPVQGRKKEIAKPEGDPNYLGWDVSPDGSQLAVFEYDFKFGKLHVYPVNGGPAQNIPTGTWANLSGVAWAADGKSLFLLSYSSRGTAVLHSNLKDVPKKIYKPGWEIWAIQASPDGKSLAFGPIIDNSNAWTMGNFPAK